MSRRGSEFGEMIKARGRSGGFVEFHCCRKE